MLGYLNQSIVPEARSHEGENVIGTPDGEAKASTTLADNHRMAKRLVGKDVDEQQQLVRILNVARHYVEHVCRAIIGKVRCVEVEAFAVKFVTFDASIVVQSSL